MFLIGFLVGVLVSVGTIILSIDYSWKEEKITLEEYEARRSQGTCVCSIITERMFEKGVD